MADLAVISELDRAFGSELELRVDKGVLHVIQHATGRMFMLAASPDSVARRAAKLTHAGEEAGVGGPAGSRSVAPGLALLSIHISEAVATAGAADTRLVIRRGGVWAE